MDEFGIQLDSKVIFVTDEGANLKKALECDNRLNCTAHVVNTSTKSVFDQDAKLPKDDRGIETNTIESCNDLVSFIRQSHVKSVSILLNIMN